MWVFQSLTLCAPNHKILKEQNIMKKQLIYLFSFILLVSCEKENIQRGIQTKVSGRLSTYYGESIINAKVRIGEFKNEFVSDGGSRDYFVRAIDSILTNSNGEYEITFKTTGEGSSYRLLINDSPNDQSFYGFYDSVEITNIGNPFIFNYNQFTKLYPCDVTINLNNITILPILIWHETTRIVNTPEITTNSTFVKRIYISKYNAQILNLSRTKSNGISQKAIFTFPASNSENLTTQIINLNESDFVDF